MHTITPKSPKENILWNSFGSFVYLFSTWLISVFVVRLSTGYEAAGVLTLAMSIFGIFLPIAQYRTYIYQVSDTKHEYSAGEYLVFRGATCAISLILVVAYTVIIGQTAYLLPIFLFSIWRSLSLLSDSCHATEQFYKRLDFAGISNFLQGIGSLIAFIIVFYYFQSLSFAFLTMCLVVVLVLLFYDLPKTKLLVKLDVQISFKKFSMLFLRCLPIVLTGMAAAASPNMPRQVINAIMGPDALGAYGTLAAPVALIQIGANYVYNPLIGIFVERYESRNRTGFVSLFAKTAFFMLIVGIACSLFLEWLGAPLLKIVYGESILDYLYLLQPLILSALCTAFMWFLNDLSQALRLFKTTAIGDIIAFVCSLVFMVPLIQTWGLNGATYTIIIANLLSIVFMLIVLYRRIRKHLIETKAGDKNRKSLPKDKVNDNSEEIDVSRAVAPHSSELLQANNLKGVPRHAVDSAEGETGCGITDKSIKNMACTKSSYPLISILIPAYKAEKYLEKALDSALEQTYGNIEIVVVDDGSIDETCSILKRYAGTYPRRIRYATQTNKGSGPTRNALLDMAEGEYITFLDADDWIEPDYIERLFEGIGENDLVLSGYSLYDSNYDLRVKSLPNASPFSKYSFCLTAGKLWKASFLNNNNLRFGTLKIGEDNVFNVCAYSKTNSIATLPYAGYCVYSHDSSASRSSSFSEGNSFLLVAQTLVNALEGTPLLKDRLFQLFIIKSLLMDLVLYKQSLSCKQLLAISRRNVEWYKSFLESQGAAFTLHCYKGASNFINALVNMYVAAVRMHLDWLLVAGVKYLPIKLTWE